MVLGREEMVHSVGAPALKPKSTQLLKGALTRPREKEHVILPYLCVWNFTFVLAILTRTLERGISLFKFWE